MRAGVRDSLYCALLCAAAALARVRARDGAFADPDPAVRLAAARWAAEQPSERGAGGSRFVPQLTRLLADAHTATMAAVALGEIGSAAASAVPALAALASHRDPLLRVRVAIALARIAPNDASAIAAIARVRASPEPWVRKLAELRR